MMVVSSAKFNEAGGAVGGSVVVGIQGIEEQTEDTTFGNTGAEGDGGGYVVSQPDMLGSTGEEIFDPNCTFQARSVACFKKWFEDFSENCSKLVGTSLQYMTYYAIRPCCLAAIDVVKCPLNLVGLSEWVVTL